MKYLLLVIILIIYSPSAYSDTQEQEVECLALNIYHEAKGEPLTGQIMVGVVVSNRVHHKSFPETFCGVIKQYKQFSWYWDGKSDRVRNLISYKKSKRVAQYIYFKHMEGTLPKYGNLLHYHADYVEPYWSTSMSREFKLGRHIFYKPISK